MRHTSWTRYGATFALIALGACADADEEGPSGVFDAGFGVDASPVSLPDTGPAQMLDAGLGAPPAVDAAAPADAGWSMDAAPWMPTLEAGAPEAGMPPPQTDAATGDNPESGRLAGMTAAHNAVRAMVQTSPPLAPLAWSETLAAYAQEWADSLAMEGCRTARHRSQAELQAKGYGENLAVMGGVSFGGSFMSTAEQAVKGWADEVMCWTYGTISGFGFGGTEKCEQSCYQAMNSDGCGHYTQIVWRKTTQVGCGVATCTSGRSSTDVWICNYSPPGNYAGQAPY